MKERFETFTLLITRISRSIRRIKNEEMAEFDLKSPHVSCLYYLYKQGQLTASQLCEVCDEDKAAISRSIEHLEKNGYITRQTGDGKRYKSPLTLTESGLEVGRRIGEKVDAVLGLAGAGLDEESRVEFYRNLTLISDNLQAICQRYGEEG